MWSDTTCVTCLNHQKSPNLAEFSMIRAFKKCNGCHVSWQFALAAVGGRVDSPSRREKPKATKKAKKNRRVPTVSCTLKWWQAIIFHARTSCGLHQACTKSAAFPRKRCISGNYWVSFWKRFVGLANWKTSFFAIAILLDKRVFPYCHPESQK